MFANEDKAFIPDLRDIFTGAVPRGLLFVKPAEWRGTHDRHTVRYTRLLQYASAYGEFPGVYDPCRGFLPAHQCGFHGSLPVAHIQGLARKIKRVFHRLVQ